MLVIDFETYWDADYSLAKMSAQEYVDDERFEVQSVAVLDTDTGRVRAALGPEVPQLLADIGVNGQVVVGHNLRFDGLILKRRFGLHPAGWLDTYGMALAVIGGQVRSHSLGACLAFFGIEAKQRQGVLKTTRGRRLKDFTREELKNLVLYNIDDVIQTWQLARLLMQAFPPDNVPVLDWVTHAAVDAPFVLDADWLDAEIRCIRQRQASLARKAGVTQETLRSDARLATLLQELGVEPPRKISPSTGEETWAFSKSDDAFLELLNHENPRVRAIVEARLAVKSTIHLSRAQRLHRIAVRSGRLAAPLNFSGAVNTHRFSGADGLNMQNLPKTSWYLEDGQWVEGPSRIRKALRAPEGHKVVVVDSANIELRVAHWLAGSETLLDAIRAGADPYCRFAERIYGEPVDPRAQEPGSDEEKRHKRMRTMGKVAMLALQYGMGASKFRHVVWSWTGELIRDDEALHVVQTYRAQHPAIPGMWRLLDSLMQIHMAGGDVGTLPMTRAFRQVFEVCSEPGMLRIVMPDGLAFKYPKLKATHEGLVYWRPYKTPADRPWAWIWGGKLLENLVQGLSACIIRHQMKHLLQWLKTQGLPPSSLALQVHDEVVLVVPAALADATLDRAIAVMGTAPAWAPGLPLAAEGGIGDSYGDAK